MDWTDILAISACVAGFLLLFYVVVIAVFGGIGFLMARRVHKGIETVIEGAPTLGEHATIEQQPAQAGEDPTPHCPFELLDWNELSRRGLIERINREIMHPIGLAVCRDPYTGISEGALVSPDGEWVYPEDGAEGNNTETSGRPNSD